MVIYDIDFVDVGLYECYVENEYGNDKCIIFVKIKRVRNVYFVFFWKDKWVLFFGIFCYKILDLDWY